VAHVSWFAVDDRFWCHRKVLALRASPHYVSAVALWTLAGTWAAGQDRERWTGTVPVHVLDLFGIPASRDALDALVGVGLWECDGDSVAFHDWDTWNGAGSREHRARTGAAERKHAQRLRDCAAGRHSKDCPTSDLEGQKWECPERAAKARHGASRDAGTGRDGPGRAGTGRAGKSAPTTEVGDAGGGDAS
jgi:hypothetical protein